MSATVVATGRDELIELVGRPLGVSEWVEIGQERVNQFADATGDHQWIHVDTDRAGESPFGGLVAHGFLTLSLLPTLIPQVLEIRGFAMALNYGLDRVRFPAPVLVGTRVRGSVEIASVDAITDGVQVATTVTVEIEDERKPACVATFLTRHLGSA